MISLLFYAAIVCAVIYFLNKWYRKDYIEDFHHKTVLITGADTGLGHDLALDLDSKGLIVYAGCYTTHGADNLRKEASSRMRILQLDVTNSESIIKAREFIERDLAHNEGLWALVNNAGIAKGGFFEFASMKDYRQVMNVNFYGPVEVIEVFLPLIKRSRGRIINVISVAGRCSALPGPYSSSKFAFESYSNGLRRWMVPYGVKVSIIEPGCMRTNMANVNTMKENIRQQWEQLPAELKDEYGTVVLQEVQKGMENLEKYSSYGSLKCLKMAIESISHAIGGRHPKDRYIIGIDAHLFYRPLCLLPDWVLDTIVYWTSSEIRKALQNKIPKSSPK